MRARWSSKQHWPRSSHPVRPYAYTVLEAMANIGRMFDCYDPGFTGQTVEYRHPLMDLRLIRFCLSLPLQPWVIKKYILRKAMKDALPAPIVRRPKSPLPGDPDLNLLKRDEYHISGRRFTRQKMKTYVTLGLLYAGPLPSREPMYLCGVAKRPEWCGSKIFDPERLADWHLPLKSIL